MKKKVGHKNDRDFHIPQAVLLNLLPEAIFILDSDQNLVFYNEPGIDYLDQEQKLAVDLKIGWSHSVPVPIKDGSERIVDIWTKTTLWNDTPALVVVFHDVSHYQALNQALKQSEERYRMISEVISDYACSVRYEPDGSVIWEWETRPYEEIVGYTLDEIKAMGGALEIIPPEDWGISQRRAEMNKKGLADVSEYRIIRADGSVRWLRDYSKPVLKDGKIIRIYGATQDITDRKNVELERDKLIHRLDILHQLEQKLLSTRSLEQIAAFTLEQIRQFSNHFAANFVMFDQNQNEKIDLAIYEDHIVKIVDYHERIGFIGIDEKLMNGEIRTHKNLREAERHFYLGLHLFKEPTDSTMLVPFIVQGELIGFLALLYMNSTEPDLEQKNMLKEVADVVALGLHNMILYQHVQKLAVTDSLTGLKNRRMLREDLEALIEKAKHEEEPLSILLFDVDDFKQVNDQYGHAIGDRLLEELSATIKRFLRKTDHAIRYGGEEFLILLPGISIMDAQLRADQIRKAVQGIRIRHKNNFIQPVTITTGIATYPYHGQIYRELLQSADLALYQGKNEGKNRVVVANVSFEDALRNHYVSIKRDDTD